MKMDYHIDHVGLEARNETASDRLVRIARMIAPLESHSVNVGEESGRNVLTRMLDLVFAGIRRYAPPIHWLATSVTALILLAYVRFVALTARVMTSGERPWPDLPAPCVIALWHRNAPSLLVAFAEGRPSPRSAIMISRDARGDMLARLCCMLGFAVVRGGTDGGWTALAELTHELEKGACVFITADGGGPMRVAKVGAVALAAAAGVPLVPLAADCSPAVEERHKWDAARNPLPFSRISIAIGKARSLSVLANASEIEEGRMWLEQAINDLTDAL